MRNETADRQLRELSSAQHGVVSRRQLRALGWSAGLIARRVRCGELVSLSRRVLQLAGVPATPLLTVMAGVLDAGPGAVASHATAAGLWGLPGFETSPVEVTAIRRLTRHGDQDLSRVHQPRRLSAGHLTTLDGVPLTTPTRVMFDLAADPRVHPARLERVLDTAWARGLVDHASLRRLLTDLEGRGRRGIVMMRELILARGAEHRPPESALESRFEEIARGLGLRDFERQIDAGGDDGWIGRVDFLDRGRGLVVEVDSHRFHSARTDQRRDEQRRRALREAGWTVVSFTDHDLFHRRQEVEARLRELRRSSGSGGANDR